MVPSSEPCHGLDVLCACGKVEYACAEGQRSTNLSPYLSKMHDSILNWKRVYGVLKSNTTDGSLDDSDRMSSKYG